MPGIEAQKKELNMLQTAHLPPPENLDNGPLPSPWDLLQVLLITIRLFITSYFSITYTAARTMGRYKDIIKIYLALGKLVA